MSQPTFGGRTLKISKEAERVVRNATREMSHNAYGLWDAYISMQVHRNRAIVAWNRVQKIHRRLDAGEGKAKRQEIMARVAELESDILKGQAAFLQAENSADGYWRQMSPSTRIRDEFHVMFGVDPHDETLIGLWRKPLGSAAAPPLGMKLLDVALQFSTAYQGIVYSNQKIR